MKKCTELMKQKRLQAAIDELTEENQRYALGVLEALAFAQATQEKTGNNQLVEADTNKNEGDLA
jgi:hypothetical protein